jgi:DNA-binding GntR family transcriptional regulator
LNVVKRTGSESLAIDVRDQLRADIFNRRFAPGERLRPTDLGERFGVSLSVTREALALLAAQNLVRIERNRGFHVTTLSPTALADLTFARKVNEGAALRLAIGRGGVAWEADVLAAHHRMASQQMYLPHDPATRNDEWAAAHLDFHYKLIEPCGNDVLLDICRRLSDAAELYRAWSGRNHEIKRDVAAEHRALLDAAMEHDANLAVALFEAHVERTAAIVLDLEFGRAAPPTTRAAATTEAG